MLRQPLSGEELAEREAKEKGDSKDVAGGDPVPAEDPPRASSSSSSSSRGSERANAKKAQDKINEALKAAKSGDDDYDFPRMPVEAQAMLVQEHRLKSSDFPVVLFSAFVARTVGKKEVASNKKALDAVLKEWEKLRKAGCWDESRVREWDDVSREAKASG